ncbi:uncharacterized protein AAGF69_013140 [Amazona ochrocephala]
MKLSSMPSARSIRGAGGAAPRRVRGNTDTVSGLAENAWHATLISRNVAPGAPDRGSHPDWLLPCRRAPRRGDPRHDHAGQQLTAAVQQHCLLKSAGWLSKDSPYLNGKKVAKEQLWFLDTEMDVPSAVHPGQSNIQSGFAWHEAETGFSSTVASGRNLGKEHDLV